MKNNDQKFVPVLIVALLFGGVLVSIFAAQRNQETRGRAASASVQLQCTAGKIQASISYTNAKAYAVDLFLDESALNIEKEYANIPAGQTKTDTFTTTKVSVANGTVRFTSSPSGDNDEDIPDEIKPYTALNCGIGTTPAITGSTTLSPTQSASGIPSPTPKLTGSPTGKKAAADINDDGFVNQVDYNLFLREISTQPGQ